MSHARLIALAESCSHVRAAIGRMLMTAEDGPERAAATEVYQRRLRELLRIAREEECGLFLEIAGELASSD
jgi:hypothetical protein